MTEPAAIPSLTRASRAYSQPLTDHLGTANTAVELSAGQPVTRRAYKPYGELRGPKPASWPNKRGYLGVGIDDADTGLTHIGAREYDQNSGRFLSADPVIDIADPLQMNGYTYANSSPISKSDPSGLKLACGPGFDTPCPKSDQNGDGVPERSRSRSEHPCVGGKDGHHHDHAGGESGTPQRRPRWNIPVSVRRTAAVRRG